MRKNLPITGRELNYPSDQKLVSTTDLKGRITHCNDDFVKVSGYAYEELIGQPHNMIRHPDMPAVAFQSMWDHLHAGKPWMGMVKNRCKNGDHYWVLAYATPITKDGKAVGYQSVRTCPTRDMVNWTEKWYAKANQGKSLPSREPLDPFAWLAFAALLAGAGLHFYAQNSLGAMIGFSGLAIALVGGYYQKRKIYGRLTHQLRGVFADPMGAWILTGQRGRLGQTCVGILSLQIHLKTINARIEELAQALAYQTGQVLNQTRTSQQALKEQQMETEQTVSAVGDMASAIGEVSSNVQSTANQAEQASRQALSGRDIAQTTLEAIKCLQVKVNDISQSVGELSAQTHNIAGAAGTIEDIAEQTNLLALNAAIEAARAGEQGRGFAVVADEVRQLAQRTQSSTHEIHNIVQRLTDQAKAAVSTADQGKADAEEGLKKVAETEALLTDIAKSLNNISAMAGNMAAAVEQQAQSSKETSTQVEHISSLGQDTMSLGQETLAGIEKLQQLSGTLQDLMEDA